MKTVSMAYVSFTLFLLLPIISSALQQPTWNQLFYPAFYQHPWAYQQPPWYPPQYFQPVSAQASKVAPRALGSFSGAGRRSLTLLTTLLGGLRHSGLEATIAGEILQRLIKTSLKDVIVPFKLSMMSGFA